VTSLAAVVVAVGGGGGAALILSQSHSRIWKSFVECDKKNASDYCAIMRWPECVLRILE